MELPMLDLDEDLQGNLLKIKAGTMFLRQSLIYGYGLYLLALISTFLYPFDILSWMIQRSSQPHTATFSNVAGPLRRRTEEEKRKGETGGVSDLVGEPSSIGGIMIPGGQHIPIAITSISQNGTVRLSVCCQEESMPDYQQFFALLESKLIELCKA